MQPATAFDSLEARDGWWMLWRALTSNVLLGALCALALAGLLAGIVLPQQPASGTADPVAYSRWEAEARNRQGALFPPFQSLGLNAIAQSAWWRLVLAALIPLAGLRLADRLARWVEARYQGEPRLRVILNGPSLERFAAQLRAQGYRVAQPATGLLVANCTPRALVFTCALHGGLVLAAGGLLLNLALGWEVRSQTATASGSVSLPSGVLLTLRDSNDANTVVVLQPNGEAVALKQGQTARTAGGIALTLEQRLSGYRVTASDDEGAALPIQASSFLSPSTEVLIVLGPQEPERYLAIPQARLALAIVTEGPRARLRAYAIPSGQLMRDGDIQAEVTIEQTTLRFQPVASAVLSARYHPGDWLWWPGVAFIAIGAIGSALFPIGRIIIQQRGDWTELYADGPRVRQTLAELTAEAPVAQKS